jgi:hypothetical protein
MLRSRRLPLKVIEHRGILGLLPPQDRGHRNFVVCFGTVACSVVYSHRS